MWLEVSCVDKAHKIAGHGNVPGWIEKLTSDLSSTALVLQTLNVRRTSVR